MRRPLLITAIAVGAGTFAVLGASGAFAGMPLINYVQLQAASPGIAETGNLNITGVAKAGSFLGSGSTLTSLNASSLASGTVPDARLSSNIAQLNKNNIFGASQTFQSHLSLVAQNGGIKFPTPSLNSTTPMITMFGDDNTNYERMILGHSVAHPTWGLKYQGWTNILSFQGAGLNTFSVDLDGGVAINTQPSTQYGLYVYGSGTGTSAARFYANGAPYALQTNGNVIFAGTAQVNNTLTVGGDTVVGNNIGIGAVTPGLDLAINDSDTGINGSAGALDFVLNGATKIYARAAGLGIGKAPSYPLDVVGRAHFRNANNADRIRIFTDAADVGNVWTLDPNGAAKAAMASRQTGGNYGAYIAAADGGGLAQAYLDCRASDGLGSVIADVKNFRAINPRDPKTDIYYASLEGPEAAMYIRGKGRLANGRARVELPDHFTDLANAQTLTIQLTPASFRSKGLGYEIDSNGDIQVGELAEGTGNYEFSWMVTAVRKGFEDYQVIRSWKEAPMMNLTEEQAWAARLKKIAAQRSNQKAP